MRLLVGTVAFCVAGLLTAASCQEKDSKQHAASEPGVQQEETIVAKSQPRPDAFAPQVAGGFYPAEPDRLRGMIEGYLAAAGKQLKPLTGDLLGIIVPHAGYPYSGPVAAHAFQLLQGRSYKRVVVLGPAHRRGFAEPALLDAPAYRTPLGDIPIDAAGVKQLASTGAARVDRAKFGDEHALEVELPFLQVVLPAFELVAVMISDPDPATAKKLARALWETFPGKDTLFVASTDMSHDYPYQVAVAMDAYAADLVTRLDTQGLFDASVAHHRAGTSVSVGKDGKPVPACLQLCGMGPVLTLLELARMGSDPRAIVLDRRNSGDIVGDPASRIVGYFSAAVTLGGERTLHAGSTVEFLGKEERRALLGIARETLEAYVRKEETRDFDPALPRLKEPGAAFVTLKKNGELRGCIGYMEPADPLWKMIRDRAIDAAVNDNRFPRVTEAELSSITIEISVLTPRVEVKDPEREIVIGRDGVWLEVGAHRGVFLPQVPVEQGWKTVEEYLDNLCRKARLYERGCWKAAGARLQRFSAQVFGEGEGL